MQPRGPVWRAQNTHTGPLLAQLFSSATTGGEKKNKKNKLGASDVTEWDVTRGEDCKGQVAVTSLTQMELRAERVSTSDTRQACPGVRTVRGPTDTDLCRH